MEERLLGCVLSSFILTWHIAKETPCGWFFVAAAAGGTSALSWHFALVTVRIPPLSDIPEFLPDPEHVYVWWSCSLCTRHHRKLTEVFHLSRFPHTLSHGTINGTVLSRVPHPEGAPNKHFITALNSEMHFLHLCF